MRTRIFKTTLLVVLVLVRAQTAVAQQDWDAVEMTVHPIAGNVSYIAGSGGNIGLFTGDDGVFLIDDQYAPLTEKIVAAIRTVSSKPIRFLVNTHMHPDHTGGNENFGKMGTMIFGHDNVRSQMAISDYAEEPPLVTFSEDMSFHINGETVHVFKTPDAHTNGDVYIKFESSNVIHTGDVYRTTSYPYMGDVRAFRDMMLVIRDRVANAIREGKSLEEAQAAGLTAEYDERWDSGRRIGSAATLIDSIYADMAN